MSSRQAAVAAFFAGHKREAAAFVSAPKRRRLSAPSSQLVPPPVLATHDGEASDAVCTDTEFEAELLAAVACDAEVAAYSAVAASSADELAAAADGVVNPAVYIAPRSTTIGLLESPEIPLQPTCGKCILVIMGPLKSIVTGRGAGCWKCLECNVKCTQLNRIFGPWPPRSFAMQ